MKIAEFSVKNYQFTIVLFIMVLLLGLSALFNMPRGEDPVFNAPIYVVTVIYPGTSPNDMEQLVAEPLEEALYELEDVKQIMTECYDGVVVIQTDFNYGVDEMTKYNDIIREVNKLRPDLPEDILDIDIIRAQSSDVNIFQHALVSKSASYQEMKLKAEELKSELEKLRELKQVKIQADFEGNSFTPEQYIQGGATTLNFSRVELKEGNYNLVQEEKLLEKISFNISDEESRLDFVVKDQLKSSLGKELAATIDILEPQADAIAREIQEEKEGIPLWKYFILGALLFLILEIAVLKLTLS